MYFISVSYFSTLSPQLFCSDSKEWRDHSAVITSFGKEFAKTGDLDSRYHQYLIKAQSIRQISDYGYNETLPKEDVEEVIGWAKAFYQAANAYLK